MIRITKNNNLKILIFSPNAIENGRGGELSSIELAAGLYKFYKISFVHTNKILGGKFLTQKTIKNKLRGIKIDFQMRFATFKISNLLFSFPYPWDIVKLFKKVKNCEIIYTSYSSIKEILLFISFSLLHRKGSYIIGYRKPLYSKKTFSFYNIKYRLSILILSLFKSNFYHHTISYHAKKFLENFYNSEKVKHIVHGVPLNEYAKKVENSNDRLNFIYVGSLDDVHKGVGVLLNSIRHLLENNKDLNVFFSFCGAGPLEFELKKLENDYPDYIKYFGYISNDRISEFYKKNDVFLFTSRREPFGRVLIEALASHLLIICTKTYGSIEVLEYKDFAFFLNELTSSELKKNIKFIYNLWKNNPQKFRNLQKEAHNYAIENYSFKKELNSFKIFIQKIFDDKIKT